MSVLFIPFNYWASIYPLGPGMSNWLHSHAGMQPWLAACALVQQMQEGP